MFHLCFIIDNSLTMDQRPNQGISLLDIVKSSIQSTFKHLERFNNTNHTIHLFCTSQPNHYLSSYQHDDSHLYYQLKSITTSIDTKPSQTIETAIQQISKFRILSQAETFKGYREGFIYEPALIFFFSDRMTKKKIYNIVYSMENEKIQMRSQYEFVSYLVGTPSFTERNLITEEHFRSQLKNQPEFTTYFSALKKINGELKLVLNFQNLNASISQKIQNFRPSLMFYFEQKQLKRKFNEFIPSQKGTIFQKTWQSHLNNLNLSLMALKIWKLPFLFQSKCNEQNGEWKVESIGKLKFNIDFTKRFVDSVSNLIPQSKYKVAPNQIIASLDNNNAEQKYPIFFQYKNMECIVGLLCPSSKGTQINFYFPNFMILNMLIKALQTKQNIKIIQSIIYPYLNSVPYFYYKYLKMFFDKLNLNIDFEAFDNAKYSQTYLILQNKLQSLRLLEKKNLPLIFQANLQNHQNYKSECCLIYSPNYSLYSQKISKKQIAYNNIQIYFSDLVNDLLSFKKKIGIEDYLSSGHIESIPVIRQLQKYNNLKRIGQDDFNENITISFGSPYRKKRKNNEVQPVRKDDLERQSFNKSINEDHINTADIQMNINQKKEQIKLKQMEKNSVNVQEKVGTNNEMIPQASSFQEKPKNAHAMTKAIEQNKQPKQERQIKVMQIKKEVALNDETLIRIHNFPINKAIQMTFNGVNLATNLMLQNQKILSTFYSKKKR